MFRVQPYKDVLLPHWRFATPDQARTSSETLLAMFARYLADGDLVGADMTRKYLQMGYAGSSLRQPPRGPQVRRAGARWDRKGVSGAHGRRELPRDVDPVKAESASIFKAAWDRVEADVDYVRMRDAHRAAFG